MKTKLELERQLFRLTRRWKTEARAFHRMGKEEARRGNPAGNEYMQTAAAFRACVTELKNVLKS